MIGRMIVKPGIEVKEVLKFVEKSSGGGGGSEQGGASSSADSLGYIFVDPANRNNVLAWTMCRNIIRVYGRAFMLRGEAYLSIDLIASLFLLACINVLLVGGVEHHIWDIGQLSVMMMALAQTVVLTSLR